MFDVLEKFHKIDLCLGSDFDYPNRRAYKFQVACCISESSRLMLMRRDPGQIWATISALKDWRELWGPRCEGPQRLPYF